MDDSTAAGAPTRSLTVFTRLREDILRGQLAPGSRLRFVELAERFTVSQSVVREALTRLAEQGLAVALPQQGFRVTPLSVAALEELTDARLELEALTLRRSIERGDIAWESSVVAAHHQLANTPTHVPDSDELNGSWFTVHEEFHRSTLRACGNDRLLSITIGLRDASALYRWWSRPIGHDYRRDVAAEHRNILEALLARDADLACARLADHIQRTTDTLREAADSPAPPVT